MGYNDINKKIKKMESETQQKEKLITDIKNLCEYLKNKRTILDSIELQIFDLRAQKEKIKTLRILENKESDSKNKKNKLQLDICANRLHSLHKEIIEHSTEHNDFLVKTFEGKQENLEMVKKLYEGKVESWNEALENIAEEVNNYKIEVFTERQISENILSELQVCKNDIISTKIIFGNYYKTYSKKVPILISKEAFKKYNAESESVFLSCDKKSETTISESIKILNKIEERFSEDARLIEMDKETLKERIGLYRYKLEKQLESIQRNENTRKMFY